MTSETNSFKARDSPGHSATAAHGACVLVGVHSGRGFLDYIDPERTRGRVLTLHLELFGQRIDGCAVAAGVEPRFQGGGTVGVPLRIDKGGCADPMALLALCCPLHVVCVERSATLSHTTGALALVCAVVLESQYRCMTRLLLRAMVSAAAHSCMLTCHCVCCTLAIGTPT
jgi:hypothetical protein